MFKHAILDQYLIRFAVMTASKLNPKHAVDGFAGRGRHDDGSPASSEFMMLAAQKAKATTHVDLFLVEKSLADYRKLDGVANEYRARGANVQTRHGERGAFLDEAIAGAAGPACSCSWTPAARTWRGTRSWPRCG